MKLFDRIPSNFFSILSRKYRSVYAFCLLVLYDALKIYKTRIKRSDYASMLRTSGGELLALFDMNEDCLEDEDSDLKESPIIDEDILNAKINYIIRKFVKTGWMTIEKETGSNAYYIYLPIYAIYSLELIQNICSDASSYVPLVHQTYSELTLEDEKRDEFMFRTLLNALSNAEKLELNVATLHHSIRVYNHRLTNIVSPNDVLKEHFDKYSNEISDNLYHPMKTYDSFSLYSLPIINILKKWSYDQHTMKMLADQAKIDKNYARLKNDERIKEINSIINKISDIFAKLYDAFSDIDEENSSYIESVQKKVHYFSNSDRSIKGKIEAILFKMAKDFDEHNGDLDQCLFVNQVTSSLALNRSVILDGNTLTMPFKRKEGEESELLSLEDALQGDDEALNDYLNKEANSFNHEAIRKFLLSKFNDEKVIETGQIEINSYDELALLILGIVNSDYDSSIISKTKYDNESVISGHYELPRYQLKRKDK